MAKDTQEIEAEVHFDMLTELPDNYSFYEQIEKITKQRTAYDIMVVAIDDFKRINDLYSYSFGDRLFKAFAQELKQSLPATTCLFRLDGNGFGLLIEHGVNTGFDCYEIIADIARKTHRVEGMNIAFDVSAGICCYPVDGSDNDTLYRNARIALSHAKTNVQKHCVMYQKEMADKAKRDMNLLEDLRMSIAHGFQGFYMVYQPIVYAKTKELFGCEALLRYQSAAYPQGLSPFVFIPILENSGLILDVGKWVMETAFKQCAEWVNLMPDFQMNVNVSARQFDDESLPEYVMNTLFRLGLQPNAITLELTESEPAQFEAVNKAFNILRKQGIKTAFDDFGTGYASLDIFRSISGDELKIDRSFLERITYDVTDQVLLKSITKMCNAMNIMSCIEGIETTDIERMVVQLEPDLLQGYLYSKPVEADVFEERFLRNKKIEHPQQGRQEHDRSALAYTTLRPAKPMPMSTIVDNAHAGIIQVGMDDNFTFLTCNEGYRRMIGYTAKEIEERFANKALGFVHPDDIEWVNEEVRRQLGKGDTLQSEFRIQRKDGRALWVYGTGNVALSPDGNPSLIVVIMDIDEIKRKSLKELERAKYLNNLMDQLPTGVACTNDDNTRHIDYISPSFLALLGYTREDIQTMYSNQYMLLVHEEDRERVLQEMQEQRKASEIVNLYYRIYCKDGSLLWIETMGTLIMGVGNRESQWCLSVVNAMEPSSAQNVQRNSDNISLQYQRAAKRWGSVMFEYDFRNECATVSKSFETMFGYTLPETNIVYFDELLGEDANIFYDALEVTKMGGKTEPIEIRMIRSDHSEIWCNVVVQPKEDCERHLTTVIGKISNIDHEYHEREINYRESQLDKLTRLFNKGALEERIRTLLRDEPKHQYALFLLDVNNFSQINKTYGHFVGDLVLKMIALRIRNIFRDNDVIGRVGGDEFMIFMKYNGEKKVLIERCKRLNEANFSTFKIKHYDPFQVNLSIGVSCSHNKGYTFAQLYEYADNALYRSKQTKDMNYFIYE